jgi:GntR family transcriptional regulator
MAHLTPAVEGAYRVLLDHVGSGIYRAGSRLPGERDLAREVGVSRATLRLALALLADEGLIVAATNRGWFVRGDITSEPPSALRSFTEMARARGATPHTRVLVQRERAATADESAQLRIASGAAVVELERLRLLDDVAICLDHTVLPISLVPALPMAQMEDASLYEYLRALGIDIVRSAYTVRAELMGERVGTLLGVPPESPALVAEELTMGPDGTPILAATLRYRADAYRFQTHHLRFSSPVRQA